MPADEADYPAPPGFTLYQHGSRIKKSGPGKGRNVLILEFLENEPPKPTTELFTMANFFGLNIDPNNLEASTVTALDSLIENEVKKEWPAASEKLPHLNQAIEGVMGVVEDLSNIYVLAKLETMTGKALDALAKKYPFAQAEVAALKSKIPAQ